MGRGAGGRGSAGRAAAIPEVSLEDASEEWFNFDSHEAIAMASRGESIADYDVQGRVISPGRQAKYEEMARILQERASQENTGLRILHRGEAHESVADLQARYPVGRTVTLRGLTATTRDLGVARVYTDPQFLGLEPGEGIRAFVHFENPRGVMGFNRDNVEYVLPHGASYRVTRSWVDDVGDHHVTLYSK